MTALDKVLSAYAAEHDAVLLSMQDDDNSALELILAAQSVLEDLCVELAFPFKKKGAKDPKDSDDDGDDDSDSGDDSDDDDDVTKDPGYKKMVAKGMPPKMAAKMVQKRKSQVKASAMAHAALLALSGVGVTGPDWVAATSVDPGSLWRLSGGGAKPYGDVTYADPKNGKYPVNNEVRIRAAWAYINKPRNAAEYPLNGVSLSSVKSKIKSAARAAGVEINDDSGD